MLRPLDRQADHNLTPMPVPPLILLGAGGHAKVVAMLAHAAGRRLIGVCDPSLATAGVHEWRGLRVLGDDTSLYCFPPDRYQLALGIGVSPGTHRRAERYIAFSKLGYCFPKLIHPLAIMDDSVFIADGAQILAGVVLQPDVQIGHNTIINTGVTIEHDSNIGNNVHVAPGAVVCGEVFVGADTFIGASATVLPRVKIGRGCLVAAGCTLAHDLTDGCIYVPHRQAQHLK
jgi:sugar O-acyltransferase (sialic acid O-acetyltransferase NeuD family)